MIASLIAVVVIATHSRLSLSNATEKLIVAQARANGALEVEADATTLELKKLKLESFVEKYNATKLPIAMSEIVSTIANTLPKNVTIEELSIDVMNSPDDQLLSGYIAGFGSNDESIASVVSEFQSKQPFEDVTMDFSRSRTVRGVRARGFRMSFSIDLTKNWDVQTSIAIAGEQK